MPPKASEMTKEQLAAYIDYSILKPEFTTSEIIALAKDGAALKCATLCVNPACIELCQPYVLGTATSICPVCDFPFGANSTASRLAQIEEAAKYDSVKEIDIVANFGLLRSGDLAAVTEDLRQVAAACAKRGKAIKVILETDALATAEIINGCRCCLEAKVDFVKTSTGFLTGHEQIGGALEVIKLMMGEIRGRAKIKASGCIRTREHFLALIDLGVDRCGVGYKSVKTVLGDE